MLLKVLIALILIYAMSCFCFPKSLCTQINSIVSNFWWGQKDKERKLHWVTWSKMCEAKELGGLGFKDMEVCNQALLAKQCWRLLSQPQSILTQVLRGKYFLNQSFLQARQGCKSSWGWQSILWERDLMNQGLRWHIGDGRPILCIEEK